MNRNDSFDVNLTGPTGLGLICTRRPRRGRSGPGLVFGLTALVLGAIACTQSPVAPPRQPELPEDLDAEIAASLGARFEAAASSPMSPELRAELAMAYHAHQYLEAACPSYRQAIALGGPSHAEAAPWSYRLAHCLRELPAPPGVAVAQLEGVVRLDPAYGPARVTLAEWLAQDGELDKALAVLDDAAAAESDPAPVRFARWRILLESGKAADMAEAAEEAYAGSNDPRIGALLGRAYRQLDDPRAGGLQHLSRVQAGAAPDPWRDAIQDFEVGFKADMDRARRWTQSGEPDRAVELLEPRLESRPDDATVITSLASAHVAARRLGDAQQILSDAIGRGIEHFAIHLNLGRVYQLGGALEPALEQTQRAIDLNPTLAGAWTQKGRQLFLARRFDEASDALDKATELDPADVEAALLLGKSRFQLGRYGAAVEELERLLATFGRHGEASLIVALAHEKTGDLDRARDAVRKGLLAPGMPGALVQALRQLETRLAVEVPSDRP
ncbi:MAG: tetratricopeptide repeat protein [Acidobacteriota bacterium]